MCNIEPLLFYKVKTQNKPLCKETNRYFVNENANLSNSCGVMQYLLIFYLLSQMDKNNKMILTEVA